MFCTSPILRDLSNPNKRSNSVVAAARGRGRGEDRVYRFACLATDFQDPPKDNVVSRPCRGVSRRGLSPHWAPSTSASLRIVFKSESPAVSSLEPPRLQIGPESRLPPCPRCVSEPPIARHGQTRPRGLKTGSNRGPRGRLRVILARFFATSAAAAAVLSQCTSALGRTRTLESPRSPFAFGLSRLFAVVRYGLRRLRRPVKPPAMSSASAVFARL